MGDVWGTDTLSRGFHVGEKIRAAEMFRTPSLHRVMSFGAYRGSFFKIMSSPKALPLTIRSYLISMLFVLLFISTVTAL